jgi:hypothetical protein
MAAEVRAEQPTLAGQVSPVVPMHTHQLRTALTVFLTLSLWNR